MKRLNCYPGMTFCPSLPPLAPNAAVVIAVVVSFKGNFDFLGAADEMLFVGDKYVTELAEKNSFLFSLIVCKFLSFSANLKW